MHLHRFRVDYICVAQGELVAGLYDARTDSPTQGQSSLLRLDAQAPQALVIPTGVVHGFYFPVGTIYLHGMTTPWDGKDEFRSNWNDPAFGIDWPMSAPLISEQDQHAPPLAHMLDTLRALSAQA
jgi:dTDP-4-dehydrorhamnose 3,5-epimerase